jgi:hypothetical protein
MVQNSNNKTMVSTCLRLMILESLCLGNELSTATTPVGRLVSDLCTPVLFLCWQPILIVLVGYFRSISSDQ